MKRLALLLALTAAAAAPADAKGPPWITIELRPYGDAFVLARTFHHGTPMPLPLSGTAEGLVNGQRRSVPLRFDPTDQMNAFGVPKTWAAEGVWVLNIGTEAEHGGAGVVVGVDRSGTAAWVRFPRSVAGSSRIATRGEIEAMLRALDAGQQPPTLGHIGWVGIVRLVAPVVIVGLLGLGVVRLGLAAVRVVRRREARAVAA
jgi:hypothetical protein